MRAGAHAAAKGHPITRSEGKSASGTSFLSPLGLEEWKGCGDVLKGQGALAGAAPTRGYVKYMY